MALLYSERSLDFDGTDDSVLVGNVAELSFDTGDAFSLSCWVKVDAVSAYHIFMGKKLGGPPPVRGYEVGIFNTGECFFALANNAPTSDVGVRFGGTTSLVGKGWHHVVVTYDGSGVAAGITAYIDAESRTISVDSDDLVGTILEPTALFRLGSSTTTNFFDGRMAEASVYDKELTASEVSAIYNAGSPPDLLSVGPTVNLVGYWRPGEHSFPTVPDLSPSGNDGTMTNMAADDIVVDAPRPRRSHYSMLFGGTDEYVDIGTFAEYQFERTSPFSVSFWTKTQTIVGGIFIGNLTIGSFRGWEISFWTNGIVGVQLVSTTASNDIDVRANPSISTGEWIHIVMTYDGSSNASGVKFYFDSTLVSQTVIRNNLTSTMVSANTLRMMSRSNLTGVVQGTALDEMSIWSKELTALEVASLYNNGVPRDATTLQIGSNLVGYWQMGDALTFPTIPDLSASGHNGTAVNMEASDVKLDAPGLSFDLPPTATQSIQFYGDASLAYVEVPHNDAYNFEWTDPWSVAVWFKTSEVADSQVLVSKRTAGNAFGWFIWTETNGRIIAYMAATNSDILRVNTTKSYSDGEWHHFCATFDGTGTAAGTLLYVDGVLVPKTVNTDTLNAGSTTTTEPLRIGRGQTRNYLGNLSDVVLYNKVLSEVEIRTLYGVRGPTDPLELVPLSNLVAYWKLGDGDVFPIATDSSGNGHHGTMLGYLHEERLINSRPPLAASNQFANGLGGQAEVNEPALRFNRNDTFSFSCWFKTSSGVNQYPALMGLLHESSPYTTAIILLIEGFSTWNPGGVAFMLAHDNPGNLELYINTNTTFNDGNWHHVVGTYNGSGLASGVVLYVDGVAVATTVRRNTLGANDFTTNGPFTIQDAANFGTATEGAVCQVSVYNKVLSLAEAQTIYNGGAPPDLNAVGPAGNLVAWWPILDTDLGTSALQDQGPNGYDMILVDTTSSIQDDAPDPLVSAYSLNFDGVNDYVSVGNVSPFQFERLNPFSVLAWVNLNLISGDVAIFCKQNASSVGYQVGINASGFLFLFLTATSVSNEIFVTATTPVIEGTGWHSIAVTYDGSSNANGVRLYVDGASAPFTITRNSLTGSPVNTSFLAIGARYVGATNSHFNGYIDEVAAYDRVLAPSEIFTLMGNDIAVDYGAVGPVDALIGWWRMGDAGPSVYPTIVDMAPKYNNPGTMTNMDSGDIVLEVPDYLYDVLLWTTYPISLAGTVGEQGDLAGFAFGTSQADVTPTPSYKMRALANPGPGYVTWVTSNDPDFAGTLAPSAIQGGSAVIASSWGIGTVQYLRVPTVDIIQSVSDVATATDPGLGVTLVLVDTAAVSWDDLDTITLPGSPQNGAEVIVKDDGGQANAKRITVASGLGIDGVPSVLISTIRGSLHVLFDGSEWRTI